MSESPTVQSSVFERHPRLVLLLVLAIAGFLVALLAEFALGRVRSRDQSLLGAAPSGRILTFREYPVASRFWTTPADPRHVYPGGLEQRRYWVDIDSNGFIAPSRVHSNPALQVVFVGGSTTECLFVNAEHRFPYRVGRLLEDSLGIPVNSYNGGRSANLSLHGVLALLGKVAPMRPKYVVLMENINDLSVLTHAGSYWGAANPRPLLTQPPDAWHAAGPLRRVGDAAHDLFPNLLDVLRAAFARTRRGKNSVDEFAASRGKEPPFNAVEAEMAFRHSLETFIAVARIWGMTPLLMTQASRFAAKPDPDLLAQWNPAVQGVTFDEVRARFGHFNDVIRRVAQEQRVPLIDLDRIIAPSRLDMYDIVHYTDAGSERVAGIITKNLIALERAEPAPVP